MDWEDESGSRTGWKSYVLMAVEGELLGHVLAIVSDVFHARKQAGDRNKAAFPGSAGGIQRLFLEILPRFYYCLVGLYHILTIKKNLSDTSHPPIPGADVNSRLRTEKFILFFGHY